MSAKSFKMIFNNPTEKTWHVGVYQKYPDFPGMSIVWKKKRVARHTSNVVLSFTLKYGVSIGGVDGGVEEEEADLGKAYQVIAEQKAWALDPKPIQVEKMRFMCTTMLTPRKFLVFLIKPVQSTLDSP